MTLTKGSYDIPVEVNQLSNFDRFQFWTGLTYTLVACANGSLLHGRSKQGAPIIKFTSKNVKLPPNRVFFLIVR